MKKFLAILVLSLLWCNIVIAKEIRTRFGFYINLPNNYVAFQDQNLDELMKEYEGEEIDKDFFNDLFAGSSRQDMNVEYYFPKNFNAELNSININVQKDSNIKDAIEIGLSELCPYFTTLFGDLYNKNVQQYYCKFNNSFTPKFKTVLHLKHDGAFPKQLLIQYMFQTFAGLTAVTAGCEPKNCNIIEKQTIQIIKSIN